MAYVSNHRKWFGMGFPKKEILMDYVSRSCDLLKKEIFDGLYKHEYIYPWLRHGGWQASLMVRYTHYIRSLRSL